MNSKNLILLAILAFCMGCFNGGIRQRQEDINVAGGGSTAGVSGTTGTGGTGGGVASDPLAEGLIPVADITSSSLKVVLSSPYHVTNAQTLTSTTFNVYLISSALPTGLETTSSSINTTDVLNHLLAQSLFE